MLFKSKTVRRLIWVSIGLILALILYALLQLADPVSIAALPETVRPFQFEGRALLVASDADMVATAYADAKLDRVAGIEDTLTVVDLPLDPDNPVVSAIAAPNSVMSWPQIIATSPDGTKAYVAEVRGTPPADVQQFDTIEDMPDGSRITVIDIANPAQPTLIETVEVGRNPRHVTISPDGRFLAIDLDEPGRELLLVQLNPDGTLGTQSYFSITDATGAPADVNSANWHPSSGFLALNLNNRSVAFYQVLAEANTVEIRPYGEPLAVGNHLSCGRFSPSGETYLISDLKWSTKPLRFLNYLMNPKGELIAIDFDTTGQQPAIAARAEVGLSPEGFAVSPDGSLIVTVNMRRTYLSNFPPVWRGKSHSSLSIVELDQATGALNPLAEYGFEGLLPEDAVFDASGNSLATVIYNYREAQPRTGAIEFWQVLRDGQPRLERTGLKLDVVRGAHVVSLVQ
ncbi:MAG: hypothetical protein ACTS3T_00005 [Almyronema sp.]